MAAGVSFAARSPSSELRLRHRWTDKAGPTGMHRSSSSSADHLLHAAGWARAA
jgi:hypothetical protein